MIDGLSWIDMTKMKYIDRVLHYDIVMRIDMATV